MLLKNTTLCAPVTQTCTPPPALYYISQLSATAPPYSQDVKEDTMTLGSFLKRNVKNLRSQVLNMSLKMSLKNVTLKMSLKMSLVVTVWLV